MADATAKRLGWNMPRLEAVLTAALTGKGEVMAEVQAHRERVIAFRSSVKALALGLL
jgi:hypothetical protein